MNIGCSLLEKRGTYYILPLDISLFSINTGVKELSFLEKIKCFSVKEIIKERKLDKGKVLIT